MKWLNAVTSITSNLNHEFILGIMILIALVICLLVEIYTRGANGKGKGCPRCGRHIDNECYDGMLCDDCSRDKYGQ